MPEMHLRQAVFTYCACGSFTKNREREKKIKKQGIQDIFIKLNYTKVYGDKYTRKHTLTLHTWIAFVVLI